MAQRIKAAGYSLKDDAERGRSISRNRRELTVVYPSLIRYRAEGDTVFILEGSARRAAAVELMGLKATRSSPSSVRLVPVLRGAGFDHQGR